MPADLGTANAAQRAADLTWALRRDPVDRDQIAEILRRHGEPDPIELTDEDLTQLRAAAHALFAVFQATTLDEAATTLNALLADHAGPPRLTRHEGTPWHLHVDATDDAPWAAWLLASSSLALATILADRQAPPGGICHAAGCEHPYVDLGRGKPRRFCSEGCATKTRVAKFRSRSR